MSTKAGGEEALLVLALALCHTTLIDDSAGAGAAPTDVAAASKIGDPFVDDPDVLRLDYAGDSPDEVALVRAAKRLGIAMIARRGALVRLKFAGVGAPEGGFDLLSEREYEVLETIPFSSARKRMSTLVRTPDGRLVLFTKGADDVMLAEARRSAVAAGKDAGESGAGAMGDALTAFARAGLRTLVVAVRRDLDEAAVDKWRQQWRAACAMPPGAAQRQRRARGRRDGARGPGLELLGATAIEDRLQPNVPRTLATLRAAGMRVWMLTGDKVETAIEVSRAGAHLDGGAGDLAHARGTCAPRPSSARRSTRRSRPPTATSRPTARSAARRAAAASTAARRRARSRRS